MRAALWRILQARSAQTNTGRALNVWWDLCCLRRCETAVLASTCADRLGPSVGVRWAGRRAFFSESERSARERVASQLSNRSVTLQELSVEGADVGQASAPQHTQQQAAARGGGACSRLLQPTLRAGHLAMAAVACSDLRSRSIRWSELWVSSVPSCHGQPYSEGEVSTHKNLRVSW